MPTAHPLPGEMDGVFELRPSPRVLLLPQLAHVRLDRLPLLTAEGLVRRQAVAEAEGRRVLLMAQAALRQALRVNCVGMIVSIVRLALVELMPASPTSFCMTSGIIRLVTRSVRLAICLPTLASHISSSCWLLLFTGECML